MITAPSKSANLARGKQPTKYFAVESEHAALQVRMQAAEAFSGEDVQPDCDERAVLGIQDGMRLGCAD